MFAVQEVSNSPCKTPIIDTLGFRCNCAQYSQSATTGKAGGMSMASKWGRNSCPLQDSSPIDQQRPDTRHSGFFAAKDTYQSARP